MTTFAVTSVNSLLCHVSNCFRMGSKFCCMRSTPTEMQSMSENDFECFASTGVNTPLIANRTTVRHFTGLKKFSTTIAIHTNDLPTTSPHGSYSDTMQEIREF
jgi:hypothetical protein